MIAAVLCGGMGTRLRDVIGEHQKCAVDVGGRPWIHRVLDFLHHGGVTETILLTGYRPEEIERAAGAWVGTLRPHMGLTSLHTTPAGPETAVQIAFAHTKAPHLLIVNGDTLLEGFPIRNFLQACETNPKNYVVRGRAWSPHAPIADAGIAFLAQGSKPRAEWPTTLLYLDIGTPAGLAEARRRFPS